MSTLGYYPPALADATTSAVSAATPLLQYGALGLLALLMVLWAAIMWRLIDKLDTRLEKVEHSVTAEAQRTREELSEEIRALILALAQSGALNGRGLTRDSDSRYPIHGDRG